MFGNRLGKTEEMKNDIQVSGTEITGPADEVISSEDRNGNGKQKRMGSLEWAWKVTGLGPWVRPLAVHGVVLQSQMLSLGPSQYFCQVYAYDYGQGRLNQRAHSARAHGPRIVFLFDGPPTAANFLP